MKKLSHKIVQKRQAGLALIGAAGMMLGLAVQALPAHHAYAAQITNRKLTLMAGASDGGSKMGGTVNHMFNFTLPTAGSVGSIKFEYCTTAAPVAGGIQCDLPGSSTGTPGDVINTAGAALGSEAVATGFSVAGGSPNGTVVLGRTAAPISAGANVAYRLDSIVNPNNAETFFVRITSHASNNGTGAIIDSGTVAAATSRQIDLTGTMPESLVFCAGESVPLLNGVPNCGGVTTGAVAFNKLFSPTDTATAKSEMAASTNAGDGYAITVNGVTMTSGSNTVPAMSSIDTSKKGVGQFGLNLKANTIAASVPAIGTEVAPLANATNYKGQALTGYDTADSFKFVTGDSVANSNSDGTDAQIYTASYIVNVPGSQPAGTYATTLTYICTPTF